MAIILEWMRTSKVHDGMSVEFIYAHRLKKEHYKLWRPRSDTYAASYLSLHCLHKLKYEPWNNKERCGSSLRGLVLVLFYCFVLQVCSAGVVCVCVCEGDEGGEGSYFVLISTSGGGGSRSFNISLVCNMYASFFSLLFFLVSLTDYVRIYSNNKYSGKLVQSFHIFIKFCSLDPFIPEFLQETVPMVNLDISLAPRL